MLTITERDGRQTHWAGIDFIAGPDGISYRSTPDTSEEFGGFVPWVCYSGPFYAETALCWPERA